MKTNKALYGFGDLNPVEENPTNDRNAQTINNLGIFAIMRESALKSYKKNIFEGSNGRYRAVVLRVEPSSQLLPLDCGLQIGLTKDNSATIKPLVQIKARIPEKHIYPEPSEFGNHDGPHQAIINLYPTFVAESPDIPAPAVGDIVWVSFGNENTQTDPIYHGPVNNFAGKLPQGKSIQNGSSAFTDCAGKLKDISQQTKEYVALAPKPESYILDGEVLLSNNKIKVPFSVVFKNAEGKFGHTNRKKKITRVILHHSATKDANATFNTLVSRRNGTHFEVDKSGTVFQYLDPGVYTTYHAGGYNSDSIGIDFTGPDPDFTDIQMSKMADLILVLCKYYKINPVPQVDYLPHNPPDQVGMPGVFGHVHWTSTSKWDPAGPLKHSNKELPIRWRMLKQMLEQRSSLGVEYDRAIVKEENKNIKISPLISGAENNEKCVQTLGGIT